MNILIADDNPIELKLLQAQLETAKHCVFPATDGVEALAVLGREEIEAIISDILMPRMDGYRLCHEVRKATGSHALPFIFYTNSYTSALDENLAFEMGADKFIKKPASASFILDALLELSAGQRPASPRNSEPIHQLQEMKEYSAALVRRLEQKSSELAITCEELSTANQALTTRTEDLRQATERLSGMNDELEKRVNERTSQLEESNKELEAFSHSAAHDLQAPIRAIDAFSRLLLEDAGAQLNLKGHQHFERILNCTRQMRELIEALLELARIKRCELRLQPVDLSGLAQDIIQELRRAEPKRELETCTGTAVTAQGDGPLLRIALQNLLNNAWKFSGKTERARIEFGVRQEEATPVYFVRDNGAGFDPAYAERLFQPFQRLHSQEEFQGSGVGLATVQRIVSRHGGRIWAESQPREGATFYFTLAQ
jgi:signal transduction histidine kinase